MGHRTRATASQLCLTIDMGGKNTKASIARCNAEGDLGEFNRVTNWSPKSGNKDDVPTLVAETKITSHDGERTRLWGYEALNAIEDHGPMYTKYDRLKLRMMDLDISSTATDVGTDDMDSLCLFYVRSLVDHLIGKTPPDTLLIFIAVPVHVYIQKANRYQSFFRNATGIPTMIRLVDESTAGRIGVKKLIADTLAATGEALNTYGIYTTMDLGSSTTVSNCLSSHMSRQ